MKVLEVIVIGLLIFNLFILGYIVIFKINSEGVQCTTDPLVYGAKALEKTNHKEILCQCSIISGNAPVLYFNSNNTWFGKSEIRSDYQGLTTEQVENLLNKLNVSNK